MRGSRRFSQAISEGDGISLLAEVDDAANAAAAEARGAEGVVVRGTVAGIREATELPILWCLESSLAEAQSAGADACLIVVEGLEDEDDRLERLHQEALDLGLDCVVEARDEDELQLALERVDPEIFLLSAGRGNVHGGLEHVLGLLPDVPAGKLAVAELAAADGDDVRELERAGVDAVIVGFADVAALVGGRPSESP
jgi:indole-3-glycerol phosphate synthase